MVSRNELLGMENIAIIGTLIEKYFDNFGQNENFFFAQNDNIKFLCIKGDTKIAAVA